MALPIFPLLLIATVFAFSAPTLNKDSVRTLWLDVQAPQGSDISQWTVQQAERIFSAEPGFQIITQAQRAEAAAHYARQPETRHANADSLYRITRKPDFWVELELAPPRVSDGRAGWLFFMGRRTLVVEANFSVISDRGDMPGLRGRLVADSSWILDYCGMLECLNTPFAAADRLEAEKDLTLRLVETLRARLEQALTIPLREKKEKELRDQKEKARIAQEKSSQTSMTPPSPMPTPAP